MTYANKNNVNLPKPWPGSLEKGREIRRNRKQVIAVCYYHMWVKEVLSQAEHV